MASAASSVASARSDERGGDVDERSAVGEVGSRDREQPAPVRDAQGCQRRRCPRAARSGAAPRVGPDSAQQLGADDVERRERAGSSRRRRAAEHDPVAGMADEVVAERGGRAEHA